MLNLERTGSAWNFTLHWRFWLFCWICCFIDYMRSRPVCDRSWRHRHPSLWTATLISHYLNSMVDFIMPIYDTISIKVFPFSFCARSDGENISSHFLFTMCVTLGPPYGLLLSSSGGKLQDWRHFNGITEIRPDTNGISWWGEGRGLSSTHTFANLHVNSGEGG